MAGNRREAFDSGDFPRFHFKGKSLGQQFCVILGDSARQLLSIRNIATGL
jgi:hypothetical protein